MVNVSSSDDIKKQVKDWRSMIFISHDFFHRWRKVLEDKYGQEEAMALVESFWESVGEGTAEKYLKSGKNPKDLEQIVNAFVRASHVMGESAKMVKEDENILLIHELCPWIESFNNYGAPGQCKSGCDKWFEIALKNISQDFKVQTENCLADGDNNCTRRFSKIKPS